jgi:hypothetical protein
LARLARTPIMTLDRRMLRGAGISAWRRPLPECSGRRGPTLGRILLCAPEAKPADPRTRGPVCEPPSCLPGPKGPSGKCAMWTCLRVLS